MKKLYLVDVSSMFFRAFYAIPPLTNEQGMPTNALYGFTSMSLRLIREEKPDYMVYCYDRPESSFRAEIYEDYKANRSEMPEDLVPQMPYIHKITEDLGIHSIDKKGFEADDIIGTLAKWGQEHDLEVIIVSGDKDFAQLVSDKVKMHDTMKNKVFDREAVIEKWGVPPEQMIDYLAMVGDSSDNIPGVRGIGPKGAQKLLSEYGSLDGVYNNIESIKGATQRKLQEGKENAYLAQKLVTIVTNLDLGPKAEDFRLKDIDKEKLKALFHELSFDAMLRKLENGSSEVGTSSGAAKTKGGSIGQTGLRNNKGVGSSKAKASHQKSNRSSESQSASVERLAMETWTLQDLQDRVDPFSEMWGLQSERGLCFCSSGRAFRVDAEASQLAEVFQAKDLHWKGFDLKSLWKELGLRRPSAPAWDNMLAAYVLKSKNTEDFAVAYDVAFGEKPSDLMSLEDLLHANQKMEVVFRAELEARRNLEILQKMELPLVPVLLAMEDVGVALDVEELSRQSKVLDKDIDVLEKEIHALAGETFNISSPKQLGPILFEKLGVPHGKKTKTGYSTGADLLEKNAKEFPICRAIINYRELTKLKSTYVDALPKLVSPVDQRLHTHFHQALTTTGRLSSSNPNLQNIPIRTERGRDVRKAFVPRPGCKLISLDYSQIELRVLAEISGDPGLQKAFREGLDVHAATASEIFGVPVAEVTKEQRRMAKAVNFGLAYGQGVYGLAETLDISRQEAKEIIENYFLKFRKVKDYMLSVVQTAKSQGYVETLFGRRRYIEELQSSRSMIQKFGERAAVNAPMQGTASDLVKLAMIEVFASVDIPMLLQVHDELIFECPEDEVTEQMAEISEIMENVASFSVPLTVNGTFGDSWP